LCAFHPLNHIVICGGNKNYFLIQCKMSPAPFVDVRNIKSASSPRFKKAVEDLKKLSLDAIKTGKSTLNKEIKFYELMKEREKNKGTALYVNLFSRVQSALKPSSLKKKSPKTTR